MFEVHFKRANERTLELKKEFFLSAERAKAVFGLNYNTSLFFRGNSFDTKQYNGLDLNEEQLARSIEALMKEDEVYNNYRGVVPTFFRDFCIEDN